MIFYKLSFSKQELSLRVKGILHKVPIKQLFSPFMMHKFYFLNETDLARILKLSLNCPWIFILWWFKYVQVLEFCKCPWKMAKLLKCPWFVLEMSLIFFWKSEWPPCRGNPRRSKLHPFKCVSTKKPQWTGLISCPPNE